MAHYLALIFYKILLFINKVAATILEMYMEIIPQELERFKSQRGSAQEEQRQLTPGSTQALEYTTQLS